MCVSFNLNINDKTEVEVEVEVEINVEVEALVRFPVGCMPSPKQVLSSIFRYRKDARHIC